MTTIKFIKLHARIQNGIGSFLGAAVHFVCVADHFGDESLDTLQSLVDEEVN